MSDDLAQGIAIWLLVVAVVVGVMILGISERTRSIRLDLGRQGYALTRIAAGEVGTSEVWVIVEVPVRAVLE